MLPCVIHKKRYIQKALLRLRSGHNKLKYFTNKLNTEISPYFPSGCQEIENNTQILIECPHHASARNPLMDFLVELVIIHVKYRCIAFLIYHDQHRKISIIKIEMIFFRPRINKNWHPVSWGESSEQTVESGETKFPIRLCVKCSTDFLPPGGHNKSVKSGYFRPFVTFHISESRRPKSEHIFNKYYVAWVLKKIRSNSPVKSKIKRNRRNRPILFLLFAHLTRPRERFGENVNININISCKYFHCSTLRALIFSYPENRFDKADKYNGLRGSWQQMWCAGC